MELWRTDVITVRVLRGRTYNREKRVVNVITVSLVQGKRVYRNSYVVTDVFF